MKKKITKSTLKSINDNCMIIEYWRLKSGVGTDYLFVSCNVTEFGTELVNKNDILLIMFVSLRVPLA